MRSLSERWVILERMVDSDVVVERKLNEKVSASSSCEMVSIIIVSTHRLE